MPPTTRLDGRVASPRRHAASSTGNEPKLKDRMQACLSQDRCEASPPQPETAETIPEKQRLSEQHILVYDLKADIQTIRAALRLCDRITRTVGA